MKTKSKIFPLWEIILAVLMAAFTVFWSVILPKITPSVISPNRVYALADSTGQFTISVFGNDLADNQFYICSLTTAGGAEVDKDIVLPGSGVGMYGHYDLSEYVERGTIPLFLTVFQHENGGNGLTSQTQLDLDPDAVIVSVYKILVDFPTTGTSMCSVEPIYMLQTEGIPDIYHKVAWAIFGADAMLVICMVCHLIREIVRRRKDRMSVDVSQEDFESQEQIKRQKGIMIKKRIYKITKFAGGIALGAAAVLSAVWLMFLFPPIGSYDNPLTEIGLILLRTLIIAGAMLLVIFGAFICEEAITTKIQDDSDEDCKEEESEKNVNPSFAITNEKMCFVNRDCLITQIKEMDLSDQALEEICKLPVYTVEQIYREQENRERFQEAKEHLQEYLDDHEDDLDDDFDYTDDDVWDIASMFAEIQDRDIADNELWNACVRIVVSQIKKRNSVSKQLNPPSQSQEEEKDENS